MTNRQLTLYSRPGCHLCEEMLAQVSHLVGDIVDIRVVDIASDPALVNAYDIRIPVLTENGRVLAEGRLDEADFLDALENRG